MKQAITLSMIIDKEERNFFQFIDKTDPKKITHGMWQKMYALLAHYRDRLHNKFIWLYEGKHYTFDVTTRNYYPTMDDDGYCTLGSIAKRGAR